MDRVVAFGTCALKVVVGEGTGGDGAVKSGAPSDTAVPAGFVNPVVNNAAAGDGVADDTTKLNSALGGSSNVWMTLGEDYRITGLVTSGSRDIISFGARILYDKAANDTAAVKIGTGQHEARRIEGLRIINQNQSNWGNDANIGLDITEVSDCTFSSILEISGFRTGIRTRAETNKASYNKIIGIGEIKNCQRGFWHEETNISGNPFTNTNFYIGGRVVVDVAVNNSTARYGIFMNAHDNIMNHIKWYGTSFDLAEDGAGAAVLMHFIGHNQGLVWYNDEGDDDEIIADGGGAANQGMWSEIWGADTPVAIPVVTKINNQRDEQQTIDLRRLLNGAAANNMEDMGGVID